MCCVAQICALLDPYRRVVGIAEAACNMGNCVKRWLKFAWRPRNYTEHIASRGLVFERLLKLTLARLLGLEQPRVLDGDDGLVGERGDELDLLVIERRDPGP